ncbi:PilZ domain-containing protein [Spartinivicinus poritis]|uniref:PilZ domain-containing protein n=1 Tax=Spartinivicinus poritis TaxID=2994640 RepID=A0ABT5ULN5_9GAMM|nr:PilZ domain-containing protein [Spartinivicinus sp. A2-2]MDE1465929.1 PilZ domain-containing protein [Spartinivicinus sp. A2-2]
MNIDRRCSERYPIQQLNCIGVLKNHRETCHIKMINISEIGVLVQTCKKLSINEMCVLCLYAINHENKGLTIYAHAQVCHCEFSDNSYFIGLEFTYFHPQRANYINHFIDDVSD